MKNLIAAAVLVIFNIMSIHAQNRIYGTVTDRNGEPLAGVNIREKGTENGTVSDKDGSVFVHRNGTEDCQGKSFRRGRDKD